MSQALQFFEGTVAGNSCNVKGGADYLDFVCYGIRISGLINPTFVAALDVGKEGVESGWRGLPHLQAYSMLDMKVTGFTHRTMSIT